MQRDRILGSDPIISAAIVRIAVYRSMSYGFSAKVNPVWARAFSLRAQSSHSGSIRVPHHRMSSRSRYSGLALLYASWAIVSTETPILLHPISVALAPSPHQTAYGFLSSIEIQTG